MLTGTIGSTGRVDGLLAAAAVANGGLPAIACYISADRVTWLAVAQIPATQTGTFCGLTGIGTATPAVSLVNGTPGWFYYLVAVY